MALTIPGSPAGEVTRHIVVKKQLKWFAISEPNEKIEELQLQTPFLGW